MIVNSVNILDGNAYLVSQGENIRNTSATNFDGVISSISSGSESLDDIFNEVAQEYDVNVNLLKAVAKAESDFDTDAVSYCGAQGIMQLMPTTAESLGVQDPFDARQNITGGAKMLAYLLDDYNGNVTLALAAYNAGSGSVSKYGGVPPYKETLGYIDRINDILGGVLSSDSRTVDGASPTDLSQSTNADDTGIIVSSRTGSTSSENTKLTALRQQIAANKYNISEQAAKNSASGISGTASQLLSLEDYMYVINTYKSILSKLFETSTKVSTGSSLDDSVDNSDSQLMNYYKAGLSGTSQSVLNMLGITK